MSRTVRLGAYILVAIVALFELGVVWLMLHPNVTPDYRAYYIDKTTTCLNQPVTASTRSAPWFRSRRKAGMQPAHPCLRPRAPHR